MKKLKKVSSKWKNLGRNFVLKGKGYYISYNPNPNASPDVALYGMMRSMLLGLSDKGTSETALVELTENGRGKMLILEGDFRENYEKCKLYSECVKFYNTKKSTHQGSWSEDK